MPNFNLPHELHIFFFYFSNVNVIIKKFVGITRQSVSRETSQSG